MSKLYELSTDFEELYDRLDTLDPEDEMYQDLLTAYFDTIEGIELEFADKAENLAVFVKRLVGAAAVMKDEEARLKARRIAAENKAERLKKYLFEQMDRIKLGKVQKPRANLSIRNNAESVMITDLSQLLAQEEYLKPRKLDEDCISKTAVKDALQAGKEVPGAELHRTRSLIIK